MKVFCVIGYLCFLLSGFGQDLNSDSLLLNWNDRSLSNSERIESAHLLARNLKSSYPDSAVNLLVDVFVLIEIEGNEVAMTENYLLTSSAFRIQGNYPMALDASQKALKIAESNENQIGIADAFLSIGQIYERQEDFEKALTYHKKALSINRSIGDQLRIALSYSNLGNIRGQLFQFHDALKAYDKSLKHLNEHENSTTMGMVYGNMGYVHFMQADSVLINNGSIDDANQFYMLSIEKSEKALKIFEAGQNLFFALNARINIALVYNSMSEFKIAQEICLSVFEESSHQKIAPIERDACECLYKSYKGLKNSDRAIFYFERFIELKDSILNRDEQRLILEKELSFNYSKQADLSQKLHNQELKSQFELSEKDAKRRNLMILAVSFVLILVIIFSVFMVSRLKIIRRKNLLIEEQKENLQRQKELVDVKNAEITDSIVYARRFQTAFLPNEKLFKSYLPESFILYKPKDIVAGDFYWLEVVEKKVIFAAADCTGHGVPGAMVSIVCNNALNRSVREYGLLDPGEILDKARELILIEFAKSESAIKDGMDIALCVLDFSEPNKTKLEYAGAHNPLWIIRNDAINIEEIKANKQPIGAFDGLNPFTSSHLEMNKGDQLYIFTDGFADQFGGEKGKKFKTANLKKLLLKIKDKSIQEQCSLMNSTFENWQGNLEQLDDVCVIGVRI